jgi:hypothetical protein
MKIPALSFLLLLWANTIFAQSFQPLPAPLLEKEVAFEQANECYIFFDNPSGDTLQLRWRRFDVSAPEDWVIDLCDYGLCYAGIPANGTMNPVYDTIQPYLKLIVQPGTTAGAAWLHFRVFEKDHESNYVDVFFSLHTPGTTSANEPEKLNFSVFPNPASDYLFIENEGDKTQLARLLNASGRLVWGQNLPAKGHAVVDVQAYSEGLYFLQFDKQVQKILIQK